jgi:hypothetical protein
MEGRVEECTGGSLRCRSTACLRGLGGFSCPLGVATFLNVIVHSTSSPANTVESFHCTNTRMVDDMVGIVVVGGARAWAAERMLGGRSSAGSDSYSYVD